MSYNFKQYLRDAITEEMKALIHPGHTPALGHPDGVWPGGAPKYPKGPHGPLPFPPGHDPYQNPEDENYPPEWPYDQEPHDFEGCPESDPNCLTQPPNTPIPPGTEWQCIDGRCGWYDGDGNWWVWTTPVWHWSTPGCTTPGSCPGYWVPQGIFITPEGYWYHPGDGNPYGTGPADFPFYRVVIDGVTYYWFGNPPSWTQTPPWDPEFQGPVPHGPTHPPACPPPGPCYEYPNGTPWPSETSPPTDWPSNQTDNWGDHDGDGVPNWNDDDWPGQSPDNYWCPSCEPPGWTACPEGEDCSGW